MERMGEEELNTINGGAVRKVMSDSENYVSVRLEPGKDSKVLFGIDNGHKVTTTDNIVTKDGCDWYEIKLPGRNSICGWIEGSLLGYEKK